MKIIVVSTLSLLLLFMLVGYGGFLVFNNSKNNNHIEPVAENERTDVYHVEAATEEIRVVASHSMNDIMNHQSNHVSNDMKKYDKNRIASNPGSTMTDRSLVLATPTDISSSNSVDGFNDEIMIRFKERIADFMNIPLIALERVITFYKLHGFPNNMAGSDRDYAIKFFSIENVSDIYYGLEDGTYVYYNDFQRIANYREPGYSGYSTINITEDHPMYKHYISCLDGEAKQIGTKNCTMGLDMQYVVCPKQTEEDANGTTAATTETCSINQYVPCSTNETAKCLELKNETDRNECETNLIVCLNYTIQDVTEDEATEQSLGYVPFTSYCMNRNIEISQVFGEVYTQGRTQCVFGLSNIPMNASNEIRLSGNYEYCKGSRTANTNDDDNGVVCDNLLIGGFWSGQYDPRLRPWYQQVRSTLLPLWTEPYPFEGVNNLGLTFARPLVDEIELSTTPANKDDESATTSTTRTAATAAAGTKQRIFKGAVAVDYELLYMMKFLVDEYGNSDRITMIVEKKEPNNIIGASTGSSSSVRVFKNDSNLICETLVDQYSECETIRIPIDKFNNQSNDRLLQRVFYEHKKAGFPINKVVRVKASDDNVDSQGYLSKGDVYIQDNAEFLEWYIFVVTPMVQSNSDSALVGDLSFVVVVALGTLGFIGCASMLVVFYSKRGENAIVYSDWRFTCLFLIGCTLLNLSSFTLIGENTTPMCKLRMWSFNFLFAAALSPLFVKVWRMARLQKASAGFRRINMTHMVALLYTLPIVAFQFCILLIFTFVDPPVQTEILESEQGPQYQEVICQSDTDAYVITQLVFDGCLIVVGCILAFQTRNLDPRFGEAKQLGFCMYNIAFTGITLVLVNRFLASDQESKIVLQACGVFWGCLFSCFAFAMPRLFEVATGAGRRTSGSSIRFSLVPTSSGKFSTLAITNTTDNVNSSSRFSFAKFNNNSNKDHGSSNNFMAQIKKEEEAKLNEQEATAAKPQDEMTNDNNTREKVESEMIVFEYSSDPPVQLLPPTSSAGATTSSLPPPITGNSSNSNNNNNNNSNWTSSSSNDVENSKETNDAQV